MSSRVALPNYLKIAGLVAMIFVSGIMLGCDKDDSPASGTSEESVGKTADSNDTGGASNGPSVEVSVRPVSDMAPRTADQTSASGSVKPVLKRRHRRHTVKLDADGNPIPNSRKRHSERKRSDEVTAPSPSENAPSETPPPLSDTSGGGGGTTGGDTSGGGTTGDGTTGTGP